MADIWHRFNNLNRLSPVRRRCPDDRRVTALRALGHRRSTSCYASSVTGMRRPPRHRRSACDTAWHELIGGGAATANAMLDTRHAGSLTWRSSSMTLRRYSVEAADSDHRCIMVRSLGARIADVTASVVATHYPGCTPMSGFDVYRFAASACLASAANLTSNELISSLSCVQVYCHAQRQADRSFQRLISSPPSERPFGPNKGTT